MSEEEKDVEVEETEEAGPQANWERREFAINENMKKVLGAAQKATEAEIALLRKKLKKLQYGG